jgi:amino acid adenylation domain-containing protein
MAQDSTAYNITSMIELHGEVNREKFQDIFRRIIRRHESLRTSFTIINEEPVQRIHDQAVFNIEFSATDAFGVHGQTRTHNVENLLKSIQSFDLTQAPLLRVILKKEDEKRHILMLDMHHIISDGTSMGVLIKDFIQLYKGETPPPPAIQYKDYACMRHYERNTGQWEKQALYWQRELAGVLPVLNLPLDFPRPPQWDFAGRQCGFVLEKAETAALKALARTNDVTLYMVLLSVYTIMLARLTGQEELLLGAPMAGRGHADILSVIGMFINTLVLRCFPVMEKPYGDYLSELKTLVLAGLENQDYPFEDLVEQMALSREVGRNPLFDAAFVLQNMDVPEINIPGLTLIPHIFDNGAAKLDISLIAEELNDTLRFTFEYRTSLFAYETMERFAGYFKQIAASVIAGSGEKLGNINMVSSEEKTRLLEEFNNTRAIIPGTTLPGLFQQQVEQTPDRVALVGAGEAEEKKSGVEPLRAASLQITYFELNEQSDRLAGILSEKGVLPDTIVGIMMERSINLIIGIWSILKAGGAYLPIDPSYPRERIQYMVQDSKAEIIVNNEFLMDAPQAPFLHHSSFIIHHSNHLAYIIYTSGSTGKPKGVMVNHRSLVNLCTWYNRYFEVTVNDRASQYLSPGFDASLWEIFPHLLKGAALYIIHNEIKLDIFALNNYFETHCITIVTLPTQVCEQFMQVSTCSLRLVHAGGDKLQQFTPRSYSLYNIYGPTENTIATTFFHVEKWSTNIPIGRPIANNCIYILNKNGMALQPVGVPGELYIGGDGLSRGYLNRPGLTAERFIHFHHSSFSIQHSILYGTGDLARWLPADPPAAGASGGVIEFLGRVDDQVKIRGFRIELGEIISRLLAFDNIKEAFVLDRQDTHGERYLCAYIVTKGNKNIEPGTLKHFLAGVLPDYMIPAYFICLEHIPLTPNGKIDKHSLPGPSIMAKDIYAEPSTAMEIQLAHIYSSLFNLDKVGIRDNFFTLGGNSLKAVRLVSQIHKILNIQVPIHQIFKTPSIGELARVLMEQKFCDNSEETVILLNSPGPAKIFAFPPMGGFGLTYLELARLMTNYAFYAFNYIDTENEEDKMKIYLDALREIQPHGPYILLGYSAGAKMCVKIAGLLENKGEEISHLIILDGYSSQDTGPGEENQEELVQFYREIEISIETLGLIHIKDKIIETMEKYRHYLETLELGGKIKTAIHFISAGNKKGNGRDNFMGRLGWQNQTLNREIIYEGHGSHHEMLAPGFIEKNSLIIETILAKENFLDC